MDETMYIAVNRSTSEIHSFTWSLDDELIILGNIVNRKDYNIIQVEIKEI